MIYVYYSLATKWRHQLGRLAPNEGIGRFPLPGEGKMQIDEKTYDAWVAQWKGGGDKDPIQEYINTTLGVVPAPADYAIVQNGVVVNLVGKADPALGHLDNEFRDWPGAQAVLTALPLVVGATYLNGVFTNPVEVVIVKQGAPV